MTDIIPYGPYAPDNSDYKGKNITIASNVLPRGDGWGPFKSSSVFSSALAAQCRGFFTARKTDASVAIFAATSTKLYLLNNSTSAWSDVSLGAGSYAALSSSKHWQFAQFGNFVVAVQGNVAPQVYDLTSSTAFAALSGSPPQSDYVSTVGRFLVLSGLTSFPYRIQWSALGDITNWSTLEADHQDFPDGGIVRGVAGGEMGVIFQENIMRRMVYDPGSDLVFQIDKITEDLGLLAPYSLIRAGDQIFWLSAKGFCQMPPTGSPALVGKELVDRAFLSTYDSGALQYVIGAGDPNSSLVFFSYRTAAGSTVGFDRLIAYDHQLKRWSPPILVSGEYIAPFSRPGLTLENLDTLSSSIDALPTSLDDVSTAALPRLAAFDLTHKLGTYAGDNLEATLVTPESAQTRRMRIRGFYPITDAATVYGSVGYRETIRDSVIYNTETLVNTAGVCPANVSTRLVRAKTRIPAAVAWNFVSGVEPISGIEGFV